MNVPIELQELLAVTKDFFIIVSAIVAIVVSIMGVRTWRRQISGQTEYELAKQILKSVLEIRETTRVIRQPFMEYSPDLDLEQTKMEQLSKEEIQWLGVQREYDRRWLPLSSAQVELNSNLLDAEVIWGDRLKESQRSWNQKINELYYSLLEFRESQHPKNGYKLEIEERQKLRKIIFGIGNDKDAYFSELSEIIEDFQADLRPIIRQYHSQRRFKFWPFNRK